MIPRNKHEMSDKTFATTIFVGCLLAFCVALCSGCAVIGKDMTGPRQCAIGRIAIDTTWGEPGHFIAARTPHPYCFTYK